MTTAARRRLWSATRLLTAALLVPWLALTVLGAWFARDLNTVVLRGFPLGFWIGAQGALLAYLALIVLYVVAMDRLEARYHAEAGDAAANAAAGCGAADDPPAS